MLLCSDRLQHFDKNHLDRNLSTEHGIATKYHANCWFLIVKLLFIHRTGNLIRVCVYIFTHNGKKWMYAVFMIKLNMRYTIQETVPAGPKRWADMSDRLDCSPDKLAIAR